MIKYNIFNPDIMEKTTFPKGLKVEYEFDQYVLSVVKNDISYGNQEGLYEIAVYKGKHQIELPGITTEGDTVKGWLTESDVNSIIKKLTTITGSEAKLLRGDNERTIV
jgi:hypothetical protein